MNAEHPRWFNNFVCENYWHSATLIGYRFFDLKLEDWDKRACEWHMRYGYGVKLSDGDSYFSGNMQRRYSVDKLAAENPLKMSETAQVMHNCWLVDRARREALKKPPPIEPPKPVPPPLPKPEPKPPEPKPEQPKNPSPGLVRFGVWFGIISSVVGVVAWFVPALKPWVAAIVPIIRAILSALGA
jgi:hypothetical protein